MHTTKLEYGAHIYTYVSLYIVRVIKETLQGVRYKGGLLHGAFDTLHAHETHC